MKSIMLWFLVFSVGKINAQYSLNIVPLPAEIKVQPGFFNLSKNTVIINSSNLDQYKIVNQLNDILINRTGFNLKSVNESEIANIKNKVGKIYITVTNDSTEAYFLSIDKNKIILKGSAHGLFYALKTFEQLITLNKIEKNKVSIQQLVITDYPRFTYRGMHLDVSRHFMPFDLVKKYLDYLALFKFNTFHWHLTDDQGWRIEIIKYPLLTQIGAYRNGTIIGHHPGTGNSQLHYGGYYTQQQIKEIVQYAAERFITVIPEIELPGHASAAIAAYPQLSCFPDENTNTDSILWAGSKNGKQVQQTWGVFEDVFCPSEFTFNFIQDVLDEVLQLFTSQYIHIGGDECPKDAWKRSTFCQQLIKENNLKDEHELQSYFIRRIEKFINSKGRKIIGWDEILEGGLAPNATVMSWCGEQGGVEAAKLGHDVIMTPSSHCYFDHSQNENEDSLTIGGFLPLHKVYGFDPMPTALNENQTKHILGAQGNVWTEYITNERKLKYMIFPRMIALSEVLWTSKKKKNWIDFTKRLEIFFKHFDLQ